MSQPSPEILAILDPYLAKIRQCITQAWEDYKRECYSIRHKATARSRASNVHDNMVYHAKIIFSEMDGVRYFEKRNLFLLIIQDILCIRFKKLDENMISRNIPTQQTLSYLSQQFEIPDLPIPKNLIAGYILNETQTEIDKCLVTLPVGTKHVRWHLDLEPIVHNIGHISKSDAVNNEVSIDFDGVEELEIYNGEN